MKYKRTSKYVPFCEKCEKEIRGSGSVVEPYHCDCGVWKWNGNDDYELVIQSDVERCGCGGKFISGGSCGGYCEKCGFPYGGIREPKNIYQSNKKK